MSTRKTKKLNANQRRTLLARVLMDNTYPTLNSLADSLGVTERQVRRDIEHLNSLGARIEKSETRRGRYVLRAPNWKPYFTSATGRKMAHIEDISQEIRSLIPADRRELFRKEIALLCPRDMRSTVVSLMKALMGVINRPEEQVRILSQVFQAASPEAWLKACLAAQRKARNRPAEPQITSFISFTEFGISMPAELGEQYPPWIEELNTLPPEELRSVIDSL